MKSGTPLYHLSIDRYPTLKSKWPADGRRKLLLRVGDEFWKKTDPKSINAAESPNTTYVDSELLQDEVDPYDPLTNGPELGILVRTDYTNEDAWQAFYAQLQEGERELVEEQTMSEDAPVDGDPSQTPKAHAQPEVSEDVEMAGDDEEDSDNDSDDERPHIFKVVNPTSPQGRAPFDHISNLAALRLLNDMDIRRAPAPLLGNKRISPPHRLVDQNGWQEIYTGKPVWIYDARSNWDQCVRVVSQEGAPLYGTATADSWRAKVSHMCEMQMNICAGMKIDFGEVDGWDYSERRRNLDEAAVPIL